MLVEATPTVAGAVHATFADFALDLSPYTDDNNDHYLLRAAIKLINGNTDGGSSRGHYVAYVNMRNWPENARDYGWFEFDDTEVKQVQAGNKQVFCNFRLCLYERYDPE